MASEKITRTTPVSSLDVDWTEFSEAPRFALRHRHLSRAALGDDYHVGVAIEELEPEPHGLRKALGRRMPESGATAHEIMAVLGHKTLAEAERYTRDADRRRGGCQAIIKMEEHSAKRDVQSASVRFGKGPEK